jgi:hypothetical protein
MGNFGSERGQPCPRVRGSGIARTSCPRSCAARTSCLATSRAGARRSDSVGASKFLREWSRRQCGPTCGGRRPACRGGAVVAARIGGWPFPAFNVCFRLFRRAGRPALRQAGTPAATVGDRPCKKTEMPSTAEHRSVSKNFSPCGLDSGRTCRLFHNSSDSTAQP